VNPLFSQRLPVGEKVTLTGGQWATSSPVQVDLRAKSSTPLVTLASVVPDQSGALAAEFSVPPVPAGTYYVSVSQGEQHSAVGLEVLSTLGNGDGLAAASPDADKAASGQVWGGLRAGSSAPSLGDVAAKPAGSSLPIGWLVGGGVALGATAVVAVAVADTRRPSRARARARG
jgi:hypothetical protein